MAEATAGEVREAVQTIAEAAGKADALQDALECAQERQEELEDAAEDIAEAALESERGKRIAKLEQDFLTWQSAANQEMARLAEANSELNRLVTELTERVSAPQTVALVTTETPAAEPSLIPPVSEVPEVTETAIVVNPADEGDARPVPEIPVPEKPRRMRFL